MLSDWSIFLLNDVFLLGSKILLCRLPQNKMLFKASKVSKIQNVLFLANLPKKQWTFFIKWVTFRPLLLDLLLLF